MLSLMILHESSTLYMIDDFHVITSSVYTLFYTKYTEVKLCGSLYLSSVYMYM